MTLRSLRTALVLPLLAAPAAFAKTSEPREILPFIADDYPKALAAAKAEGKPIFLEAWAPW